MTIIPLSVVKKMNLDNIVVHIEPLNLDPKLIAKLISEEIEKREPLK